MFYQLFFWTVSRGSKANSYLLIKRTLLERTPEAHWLRKTVVWVRPRMNNRHFQFRNNFPSEDLSMTLTFVNSSVSFSLRSFKAALDFSHLNEVRNKINRRVFLIEWAVRWKCGERRRLLREDINRENRKISSTIKFKIYRLPSSNASCMPIPFPHSQFYRHGAIVPALLKYNLNTHFINTKQQTN